MIVLTETRCSEGNTDYIPGYVSFNSARSEKSGGGVYVFLKNNLGCCITETNDVSSESIEFVHVKLQEHRSTNIFVIVPYRPPYHNSLTRFTSDTDDILKSVPKLQTTVIGGDTNIHLLSPDNSKRAFVEVMFSSSLDQHITIPTRVTENTVTLIDHT